MYSGYPLLVSYNLSSIISLCFSMKRRPQYAGIESLDPLRGATTITCILYCTFILIFDTESRIIIYALRSSLLFIIIYLNTAATSIKPSSHQLNK